MLSQSLVPAIEIVVIKFGQAGSGAKTESDAAAGEWLECDLRAHATRFSGTHALQVVPESIRLAGTDKRHFTPSGWNESLTSPDIAFLTSRCTTS